MDKLISRRDLEFLLYEVLEVEALTQRERYRDHSRQTFKDILEVAHKIAVEHFATHNKKNDQQEPYFDGEKVHTNPEVKAALEAYRQAGLFAATHDYELGGIQLPYVISTAYGAFFKAANIATASFALLTAGNANVLRKYGSPSQQKKYLLPQLEGRFFGTMCLSEPHAGSSLTDILTRAEPQPDGTYRLNGSKMWISGGDHEISENIVHLVLAKIPGGPPGVKGISLFIVPKFLVGEDGRLGPRNGVKLAGLNHKMGYRGIPNCLLSLEDAVGELVGEPHQGLSYMFTMMNEARIGVGMGAMALAYTGYLHALEYARGRTQGRRLSDKNPASPAVPILQHPDVRRMLLMQKAYAEGSLHLCLYAARLVDEERTAPTPEAAQQAHLLLELLTPVVKGWSSELGLKANELALQVHGGYGYTRDYNVEQFYRDNRLNAIHEGTNGIQALDLLARKVGMQGGAAYKLWVREIERTIAQSRGPGSELKEYADRLEQALNTTTEVTQLLLSKAAEGAVERAFANSFAYLELFGTVTLAWLWLQQAQKSMGREGAFYRGKLEAARYFYHYELDKVPLLAARLRRLDDVFLCPEQDWLAEC
ncbi:MAG: acyl-CoA dehydrogenase [Meiothermus sp.]|uniref:acyl-CoA dehydrogenase n=1 Tax=Meiothermus sp. TaxID=1955249 RepID=UPI0025F71874|nr:acyl-CoA dehydrogenase [Meiothermus sp.]MCS7069163.1 acyl-CoA dehydrogenase [Meiothermus sp.]